MKKRNEIKQTENEWNVCVFRCSSIVFVRANQYDQRTYECTKHNSMNKRARCGVVHS